MDERLRALFSTAAASWFEECVGEPTSVQREGWPAIARGGHVLISAPTGTGKTLTAFLMLIDRLNTLAQEGRLEDRLYAVYISPLKALGNDIRLNLARPIEGLSAPVRVAIRNGDTPAGERQKMLRRPPHILITTPESLFLLITTLPGRRMLSTADTVIVDEFHAVLGSKRGTHLLLSLTRLEALCPRPVQRIGLSATIRPLETAACFLGGEKTAVVAPAAQKDKDVRVLWPKDTAQTGSGGSVWPAVCGYIHEQAQKYRTVLVFCEGRAVAEKVASGVNALGGEGFALTHHGSLDRDRRAEAETALKNGKLKVLCATSSMELGIDVGDIDLVVQVGCPIRLSGAMQRLGRAGHRPGAVSVMRFLPRMDQEILLSAMTAKAMDSGHIEKTTPPEMCLDILAQHLVSMAAAGDYTVDEALALVRRCAPYARLTKETLCGVLKMLSGDMEHDRDRPVRPRVLYDRIHETVSGDSYSRALACAAGGTIPDRGMYQVCLEDGVTKLGELEEEFVYEARPGDKFFLGAFAWRITEIRRDRVIVRAASPSGAQAPFWRGEGQGRDAETGFLFGKMLRGMEDAYRSGGLIGYLTDMTGDEGAAGRLYDCLDRQLRINGCLANDRTLVEEYFTDDAGDHQMMLHCPLGGRINQGLSMLLRREAALRCEGDVRVWYDEDGVLLRVTGEDVPRGLMTALRPEDAPEILRREMPAAAQFAIAFRHNMDRALMMGMRRGGRTPLWIQRLRGEEALDAAADRADHPMLVETMRECLNDALDTGAIVSLLKDIVAGRIGIVTRDSGTVPSPMTLSLRRQVEAEMMYEYAPAPQKVRTLDIPADAEAIRPERDALEAAVSAPKAPDSKEALHTKLMIEGDMTVGEAAAPLVWFEELEAAGRARYIEPGLWIPAEMDELYRAALAEKDRPALERIIRRALRCRGAQDAASLCQRYALDEADVLNALNALTEGGYAVRQDGLYIHSDIYTRAQRMTVSARRAAISTAPPEAYAALLARWQTVFAGSPSERLAAAVKKLYGLFLPAALWESAVLPARTDRFTPDMTDELLMSGDTVWRVDESGEQLAFFPADAIDWNADIPSRDTAPAAEALRGLLIRRGAQSEYALSAALNGADVKKPLQHMALKGDAACDSFLPFRKPSAETKRRIMGYPRRRGGLRWEIARPVREESLNERVGRVFDRFGILCRETAQACGLPFSEATDLLRRMEYTGRCRRGYFVRGLSGAQFVRCGDFDRIVSLLGEPAEDCFALNAADPAQAWGRILSVDRSADAAFLCVPGTVVVTDRGRVSLILERQGACLRAPDPTPAAFEALVSAFRSGKIYPHLLMLTVKEYPASCADALRAAGFFREMREMVLTV